MCLSVEFLPECLPVPGQWSQEQSLSHCAFPPRAKTPRGIPFLLSWARAQYPFPSSHPDNHCPVLPLLDSAQGLGKDRFHFLGFYWP
jgi:hypothetical protein